MNSKKPIRLALLVDEYFGALGTAFGGYGFLARRYVAKYLPCEEIQVDVLIRRKKSLLFAKKDLVDGVNVWHLPRYAWLARRWLKKQNYDIYLSIELTSASARIMRLVDKSKKLILWIQDPRPKKDWDEISTVGLLQEKSYYNQQDYDFVESLYKENRVDFVSQGFFLNPKAIELYSLPPTVSITYLPNPVEMPADQGVDATQFSKKNMIIFLGRIESVKRGWLFGEIAKKMPEFEFYILGQTFREKGENSAIMQKYSNIENLHFPGHVDGPEKESFLREAKILVNTSIHEALPVSFLEALAHGTLLVSNQNPENLTSKFGIWVGEVLGDGFDKVDLFVNAIRRIMNDESFRCEHAKAAVKYIQETHNINRFVRDMSQIVLKKARPSEKS
ncbi:glycosyltransferase family 4 protein [Ereboglobus sp. PH5-10]|uniref:glycosyltransferase family 4 protein n=1 Tax=Ereboglobus sp. PH5-10 TaxID=2940629 RepID=UPI0031B840E7